MKIYCRACRALLPPDAKFCQACGAPLLDRAVVVEESCVACGASLASTAKFCRSCGAAVASATAATPVTPAKEHFVASVAPPALPQRDAAHSLPPVALVAAPEQAKRCWASPSLLVPHFSFGNGSSLLINPHPRAVRRMRSNRIVKLTQARPKRHSIPMVSRASSILMHPIWRWIYPPASSVTPPQNCRN